jgi:PIN domain nuclease of toxin-antitoxin system
MKHLLDTHTLLWYALNDPQLSGTTRARIQDPNQYFQRQVANYFTSTATLGKNSILSHFLLFSDRSAQGSP